MHLLINVVYNELYVLEPGETKEVKAASDPIGLKIGVIYDAAPEGQLLFYERYQVKNKSVLTITYLNGEDISTFGGISVEVSHKLSSFDIKQYFLFQC